MLKFAAFLFSRLFFAAIPIVVFPPCAHSSEAADVYIQQAIAKKLYSEKVWLRLGHYRQSGGGYLSESVNPAFFVDPTGRTDPKAELIATLKAAFAGTVRPPPKKDAPAMTVPCQFPARWKWLSRELNINSTVLKPQACKDYDEYRQKVNAQSVTLVFSAYYINNPSSIFGHLLFRLNNKDRPLHGGGSELLDYGVNYGIIADQSNPVLYSLFGMMGMFQGEYAMVPYYFKVREYSDSESRDLWEYELNLSPEELDRLVDHLWELASTNFDYYYFSQNCAYHLLSVLDAAAPRLDLLAKTRFLVIPSDALKIVTKEPGLLKSVHYRTSPLRQLSVRYQKLSKEEQKAFLNVADDEKPVEALGQNLSPESRAHVLDTVLDYIDFRYMHELVFDKNAKIAARKQNVLSVRSHLPSGEDISVVASDEERPDLSHPSFRYSVGGGTYEDNQGRTSLIDGEFRFAFHSIYDPLNGLLPNSGIESWRIRARAYPERRRLDLQEFVLAEIRSLAPIGSLAKTSSFHVYFGIDRTHDRRCDNCLAGKIRFNGGATIAPFHDTTLLYFLVGPVGETSPEFSDAKFTAGLASQLGARLKFSPHFQIDFEGEWRRVFDRETFDRLAAVERVRFDFGKPEQSPSAIEAEITQETNTQALIARYLKFF